MPGDVAVVGFDDLESAAWTDPPLTTVRQDVEGMGRLMARLLLRRIAAGGAAPGPGEPEPEPGPAGPAEADTGPVITEARLVLRESA